MAFIDKNTKVIVQGITGNQGSFHTKLMLEYGTKIVAGVTPGKAGEYVHGVPVFNTVKQALKKIKAQWSILFVPAPFVKHAAIEALNAGLNIVIITEATPIHDMMEIAQLAIKKKQIVIGPNTAGVIIPGEIKIGIMPTKIFSKGDTAVLSRSGTLTYEIVAAMQMKGIGISTMMGIGGDQINGFDFVDALKVLNHDKQTKRIVLIGEIGGTNEERAAAYIAKHVKKKVVAYIAGRNAPEGKKMGHAGAIISRGSGRAIDKIKALKKAGVKIAKLPKDVANMIS